VLWPRMLRTLHNSLRWKASRDFDISESPCAHVVGQNWQYKGVVQAKSQLLRDMLVLKPYRPYNVLTAAMTSCAHVWLHLQHKKALLSQRWPRDASYSTYMLFTLILFTLTATILCTDFDSERIWAPEILFISARVTFRLFKVIRGHWFWCQSKARMRLPIY